MDVRRLWAILDIPITYIPMSDVFYTMPITLVQFLLRYLPTQGLLDLDGRNSQKYLNQTWAYF